MSDDMEWQSGPFCRHWGDPFTCDEMCQKCGHPCSSHEQERPAICNVDDCSCEKFAWPDTDDALRNPLLK